MNSLEQLVAICSTLLVIINIFRIRIRIDNIVSLSYYVLIVFLFFGSFVSLGGDWWIRNVSDENIHTAFLLFHFSFIWFSLVVLIYTGIKDNSSINLLNLKHQTGIDRLLFPFLLILIIIVSIMVFLPDSALMAFFKQIKSSGELAKLRSEQGFYFKGPKILLYFKNLIMGTVLIYMVALYGITHYLKRQYSRRFQIVFCVTAALLLFDLSKAPIVILVLLLFLLRYRYAGSRIKFRRYFLAGAVVLLIVYSFAFNISVWESIPRVLHRLTVSQYVGFPVSLEVFPSQHEYLGLNSISGSVSKLIGKEYIQYSRILMEFSNPIGVSNRTAGYLSTYYLAEAYAIKGLWLTLLVAFLVPVFLVLLDTFFRRSNDIFFQAFYMVLLIKVPFILIDGFTRLFINTELLFLFALVLSIRLINQIAFKKQND